MQRTLFSAVFMFASISAATAGTIVNGSWTPSGCGNVPEAPVIEQSSVDVYNKSIKAINEWQQIASTYNTCLINEANADNALIAKTANEEQARFRAAIQKIKTETDAAKAKLDSR